MKYQMNLKKTLIKEKPQIAPNWSNAKDSKTLWNRRTRTFDRASKEQCLTSLAIFQTKI